MKMTKILAAMCGIAMAVCGCATNDKVGTGAPDDYKQCAERAQPSSVVAMNRRSNINS